MPCVLIVDDDKLMCEALAAVVAQLGHEPHFVHSAADALDEAQRSAYDVVFLDVRLPDGNGIEILSELRQSPAHPEVIIITGLGERESAELAIRSGAWDYVQKGASLGAMKLPLIRALQYRADRDLPAAEPAVNREGLQGTSAMTADLVRLVGQAARSEANVLLVGETGTGKEVCARAIHNNSRRAAKPFVVLDCASIPQPLLGSELFGYERGAFTGADRAKPGLIEQADQGTLFLDEVGELPLEFQKTFLRVLQERRFRSIGGRSETASDFRLVAATNRDLNDMVSHGLFRQDLLFRLRTVEIELRPLRDHPEDIPEICAHHNQRICRRLGISPKLLSDDFIAALTPYRWPGNVRELVNVLERAIVLAASEKSLFATHLPVEIRLSALEIPPSFVASEHTGEVFGEMGDLPSYKEARQAALDAMEPSYLKALLVRTDGDIKRACRVSGLGTTRLYELLKKHGMSRKRS